jgi:HK97 family phage major capsid protein
MTIEELRAAITWISACLRSIHEAAVARGADLTDTTARAEASALTEDEQTRWDAGNGELERLRPLLVRAEEVERLADAGGSVSGDGAPGGAPGVIVRSDPYNLDDISFGDLDAVRDQALRAIEADTSAFPEDRHREEAERVVRDLGSAVAARIAVTSSPAYGRAFMKLVAGRGHLLSEDERTAMERAVSIGGGGTAGLAVPAPIDTTIIDTGTHSTNPFRQISTIKKITGTFWTGVASAGVTASWDGEATQVSDDAPTLTQPQIPTFKGAAFVPFSLESEDWAGMASDVHQMIVVAKDDLEGAAFATGNGTTAPQGTVTALDGTAQEIGPTTAETFARADLDKLEGSLAARFRGNASWVANKVWYNGVRAFETTIAVGSLLARTTGNGPGRLELLGYPAYESSDMDAVLPNAAASADNFGFVFGDFRQGYYIVDRVGLNVELVPHLFGADGRPTGQRGFYAWFRTGAEVVNLKALVMLSIPTTA